MLNSRLKRLITVIVVLGCALALEAQVSSIKGPLNTGINGGAAGSSLGGGIINVGAGTPVSPTYTYAESGFCSFDSGDGNCNTDSATEVDTTVDTVNGHVVAVNCQQFGGAAGSPVVTDINGENWIDEGDLGSTGKHSAVYVALIANGGAGDDITCTASTPGAPVTFLSMTIDGFSSSTGWKDAGDGTPTDPATANYNTQTTNTPCNTTTAPTSQANELVYGACYGTTNTATSAAGFTVAQIADFASNGLSLTAFQSVTTISSPVFLTDGVTLNGQVLILTFEPN